MKPYQVLLFKYGFKSNQIQDRNGPNGRILPYYNNKKYCRERFDFFPSQTGAGLEDYSFLWLTTTNITHGLQTAGLCHWLATWLSQFIGCCFMKAGSDKKLPGWFTGSSRGGRFIINTLDFTSSHHQSQSDLLRPAQPFPSWLTTFQLYLDLRHGHHHHQYHCPAKINCLTAARLFFCSI